MVSVKWPTFASIKPFLLNCKLPMKCNLSIYQRWFLGSIQTDANTYATSLLAWYHLWCKMMYSQQNPDFARIWLVKYFIWFELSWLVYGTTKIWSIWENKVFSTEFIKNENTIFRMIQLISDGNNGPWKSNVGIFWSSMIKTSVELKKYLMGSILLAKFYIQLALLHCAPKVWSC